MELTFVVTSLSELPPITMIRMPHTYRTIITISKHLIFSLRTKKATITVIGGAMSLTTEIMVSGMNLVTENLIMLLRTP